VSGATAAPSGACGTGTATIRLTAAAAGDTGAARSGTHATGRTGATARVAPTGRGHQVTCSGGRGASGGAPSSADSTPRSRAARVRAVGRSAGAGAWLCSISGHTTGASPGGGTGAHRPCRASTWLGGPPRYGLRPQSSS